MANLHISDGSAAFSKFLVFYVMKCYGFVQYAENVCCWRKVFSADSLQVKLF